MEQEIRMVVEQGATCICLSLDLLPPFDLILISAVAYGFCHSKPDCSYDLLRANVFRTVEVHKGL